MGGTLNEPDDGQSKERIVTSVKGWVADFTVAVANEDHQGVELLFAMLGHGVRTQAVLLLLGDIAAAAPPELVAEATERPRLVKDAPRRRAA